MNGLQLSIMRIVDDHGRKQDCPVTLGEICSSLEGAPNETIKYSIRALIKAGYLRKSVVRSKTVSYIQLRSLS